MKFKLWLFIKKFPFAYLWSKASQVIEIKLRRKKGGVLSISWWNEISALYNRQFNYFKRNWFFISSYFSSKRAIVKLLVSRFTVVPRLVSNSPKQPYHQQQTQTTAPGSVPVKECLGLCYISVGLSPPESKKKVY